VETKKHESFSTLCVRSNVKLSVAALVESESEGLTGSEPCRGCASVASANSVTWWIVLYASEIVRARTRLNARDLNEVAVGS